MGFEGGWRQLFHGQSMPGSAEMRHAASEIAVKIYA